ncbi:MAG: hypothetical protein IKM32_05890, partial [Clostridia bacterium]|nr:hypothetical protein [Clostridia bacterium]
EEKKENIKRKREFQKQKQKQKSRILQYDQATTAATAAAATKGLNASALKRRIGFLLEKDGMTLLCRYGIIAL